MNRLPALLFLTFFFFSSGAVAADKVVVIPLGGAKNYMYWQSDWSVDTSHKTGDGVQYEGSSYVCVLAHQSTFPDSPPSLYWDILALKGDTGDQVPVGQAKGLSIGNVVTGGGGLVWLDRNLGAGQVATAFDDAAAYGDLYQWGRGVDGHESRTSPTTTVLSSSDSPKHDNFILAPGFPFDWREGQNANLWQGVAGLNNPCPAGFRLPTVTELETERGSWGSDNAVGAYASPLKLVAAGYRNHLSGSLIFVGSDGYYWSSTVNGSYSRATCTSPARLPTRATITTVRTGFLSVASRIKTL